MTARREGVSPITSERLLKTMCSALCSKGVFEDLLGDETHPLTSSLIRLQPSHHLVDTCLEQSLMGHGASHTRALIVLDATECRYLHHQTGGAWTGRVGLSSLCSDDVLEPLTCLVAEDDGMRVHSVADVPHEVGWLAESAHLAKACEALGLGSLVPPRLPALLGRVSGMSLHARLHADGGGFELILAPVRTGVEQRFSRAPYREQLLSLLRDVGCDERRLGALVRASFVYGFPYRTANDGQGPRKVHEGRQRG